MCHGARGGTTTSWSIPVASVEIGAETCTGTRAEWRTRPSDASGAIASADSVRRSRPSSSAHTARSQSSSSTASTASHEQHPVALFAVRGVARDVRDAARAHSGPGQARGRSRAARTAAPARCAPPHRPWLGDAAAPRTRSLRRAGRGTRSPPPSRHSRAQRGGLPQATQTC